MQAVAAHIRPAAFSYFDGGPAASVITGRNLFWTSILPTSAAVNDKNESEVQTEVTTQPQTNRKHLPKAFVPATIAGIIAAIGTAGFFFLALGPGNNPEGRGDGMISAAAANSVGATITPTAPPR